MRTRVLLREVGGKRVREGDVIMTAEFRVRKRLEGERRGHKPMHVGDL